MTATTMPFSRSFNAYLTETRFEILRVLRMPAIVVPIVVMPVVFYLLLGVMMADMRHKLPGDGPMTDSHIFISFAIYGVMVCGLISISSLLSFDRTQGLLTFKRALPMPPASHVVAMLVMSLLFAVAVMTALLILAVNFGGVHLPPASLALLFVTMVFGIAPACAMGLFIAMLLPTSGASAISSTVFIAMIMLAGLFYPLPPALEAMRPLWPAYHLQQLGYAAIGSPSHGDALGHVLVLIAVTIGFALPATWRLARTG